MNKPLVLTALLLIAVVACPLRAVYPTPQSVEKLLLLAKFGQLRDGLASQVDRAIDMTSKQVLRNEAMTPAQKAIVEDLKAKMKAAIDQELKWENIREAYIKIYSDNFTQAQIDGLIAFYQTPVGQVFAEHQPLIEQQMQTILQPQMVPLTIKVQTLIREAMMKLRDMAIAAKAAAAPKPAPAPAPTLSVSPAPAAAPSAEKAAPAPGK